MNLFTKEGTLHKEVWIATSAVSIVGTPYNYYYDLYANGLYQYSAPAQTLAMAELFINNTPLVFKE